MLRKLEQNQTAQRLIDVTVELIDKQSGVQGVNLRKIAKLAGCAHTNVYNYFENFDGLLWAAFEHILGQWQKYGQAHLRIDLSPKETFADFIGVQVDFALEHSGWYRFIWIEPFYGTPPQVIYDLFRGLRGAFLHLIMAAAENPITEEQGTVVEEMLHGYCHGDLCKLISRRTFVPNIEQHKQHIMANCRTLLRTLTQAITSPL